MLSKKAFTLILQQGRWNPFILKYSPSFPHSSVLPLSLQHRYNSQRCNFTKQSRTTYPRLYKTKIYLEDGSSVTVRCDKPRKFIQLPVDMMALSENEQKHLWLMRKETVVTFDESDIDDDFRSSDYMKFMK